MSRVSSDEQAKGYSLDVQEEALFKYCRNHNIKVEYNFREDHSAKTFDRPGYKEFKNLLASGKLKVDLLLFTTWDRFSRNIRESLSVIEWLRKHSITAEAIEQPLDMSVPENLAMLAFYLAMPEIDNKRRSIKIKGGIREALKCGRWVRKAPIGYKNSRDEQNKPIIVPSEKAALVKLAFSSIAANMEQAKIRSTLEQKGLKLSRSNLSRLLRNLVYIGKIIVPASDDEPTTIVNGLHESIISESLFYKVQNILNGRVQSKNKAKFHTKRPELPLRGSLLCSICGNKLTGSASRSKTGKLHFYYHCNHCHKERHRAISVNESVSELMKSLKFKGNCNELYKMILDDVLHEKNAEKKSTSSNGEKKFKEISQRLEKLQDMLLDGVVTSDDYLQIKTRYEAERNKIELNLKQFRTDDRSMQVKLNKCYKVLSKLDELYEKANHDNKKRLVSSIFPDKIIFDGKKSRTPRMNEVLRLATLIDKTSDKKKTGQSTEKSTLSRWVELERFELSSKQVAEMLSTCLAFYCFS